MVFVNVSSPLTGTGKSQATIRALIGFNPQVFALNMVTDCVSPTKSLIADSTDPTTFNGLMGTYQLGQFSLALSCIQTQEKLLEIWK